MEKCPARFQDIYIYSWIRTKIKIKHMNKTRAKWCNCWIVTRVPETPSAQQVRTLALEHILEASSSSSNLHLRFPGHNQATQFNTLQCHFCFSWQKTRPSWPYETLSEVYIHKISDMSGWRDRTPWWQCIPRLLLMKCPLTNSCRDDDRRECLTKREWGSLITKAIIWVAPCVLLE